MLKVCSELHDFREIVRNKAEHDFLEIVQLRAHFQCNFLGATQFLKYDHALRTLEETANRFALCIRETTD